jgi:hypothetical protein
MIGCFENLDAARCCHSSETGVLATYDIRRENDSLPHQLTDLLTTDKLIE